ncbi:hypothetical protein N7462_003713 [Penicillium macrosclerotiorum]|uniref:uncharacterized protein n=1 Tax=Penicillium macrosclerotiorum TaxID=303699 RepID=UPI002546E449|nr:uncharacterized protein N7462_003713 [Penicillium macrosclerotiorum]KAJ5689321.1 hypothetical protein N7462_003713 [Penicillium macrosclerotiorum]
MKSITKQSSTTVLLWSWREASMGVTETRNFRMLNQLCGSNRTVVLSHGTVADGTLAGIRGRGSSIAPASDPYWAVQLNTGGKKETARC